MDREAGARWEPQEVLVQAPLTAMERGEALVLSMMKEQSEAASTSGSSRGSWGWGAIPEGAGAETRPELMVAPAGRTRQEGAAAGARRRRLGGAPLGAFAHRRRSGARSGPRQRWGGAASWG